MDNGMICSNNKVIYLNTLRIDKHEIINTNCDLIPFLKDFGFVFNWEARWLKDRGRIEQWSQNQDVRGSNPSQCTSAIFVNALIHITKSLGVDLKPSAQWLPTYNIHMLS